MNIKLTASEATVEHDGSVYVIENKDVDFITNLMKEKLGLNKRKKKPKK